MKKLIILVIAAVFSVGYLNAQVDDFEKFKQQEADRLKKMKQQQESSIKQLDEDFKAYKIKENAKFAKFMEDEWQRFENFKATGIVYSRPKLEEIPVAKPNNRIKKVKAPRAVKPLPQLPQVNKNVVVVSAPDAQLRQNNYLVQQRINKQISAPTLKTEKLVSKNSKSVDTTRAIKKLAPAVKTDKVQFSFYNIKLDIPFSDKLKITSKSVKEADIAQYYNLMSEAPTEVLWADIDTLVKGFGLNEWGYFCILRDLSEKVFDNMNDRVLFCFYMLRDGGFKARLARGATTGNLSLLLALDNSKEVYSYSFFKFNNLKYYTVFGGGDGTENVYSYDEYANDKELKQMGLDFYSTLNLGACNKIRTLKVNKVDGLEINIPYNSSHLKYLNDIPMTIFPIYFETGASIEAQQVLFDTFGKLREQYNEVQFVDILLNFVQTAFEYQTDEEQFGFEKYFYPEEVIGYPYSDCEDRSAMFAWLVRTFTDCEVVGLLYPGHLATAVSFSKQADVSGSAFTYKNKRYIVCDPTYINASVGMQMPQFKNTTFKIIAM